MHDATLAGLNRCQTFAQFLDAVARARSRGLRLCAHLILGLPGETRAMMLETAEAVARLELDGVKLHHLYLSPNTALEQRHRRDPVALLGLPEYVGLVCDVLERLPPRTVIERLVGELDGPYVAAPRWGRTKAEITGLVEAELTRRDSRQGSRYRGRSAISVEAAGPG
jgi:radical SAM protein (TIGR01212 family)